MSETADDGESTATVIDRLAARFPTLEREHITQVVNEEHDRLNGARVRDFIPVLVEHEATERLRLEAQPLLSSTEAGDGAAVVDGPSALDPMEVQRRAEPPGGPHLGNYGGS